MTQVKSVLVYTLCAVVVVVFCIIYLGRQSVHSPWTQLTTVRNSSSETQTNISEQLLYHSQGEPSIQFGPYEGKYFEDLCNATDEDEWLVECSSVPSRPLTPTEAAGGDILFSVRTTLKYHDTRPREILDTWLQDVDPHNVFFVTDARDRRLEDRMTQGMHLVLAPGGKKHDRQDLCMKTGVEMQLMFIPENSKFNWHCHVDDDMYVNVKSLIRALSHFTPKTEPVYFGRSGYRSVVTGTEKFSKKSMYYAQGGMYCLSRVLLEKAKDYIVGPETLRQTCQGALLPDDITLGLVMVAVLKETLNSTNMIFTHYLGSTPDNADAPYFKDQIAFPYGFGTSEWAGKCNTTMIPGKLFHEEEDPSQFRSLHCFLNSDVDWCVKKRRKMGMSKRESN